MFVVMSSSRRTLPPHPTSLHTRDTSKDLARDPDVPSVTRASAASPPASTQNHRWDPDLEEWVSRTNSPQGSVKKEEPPEEDPDDSGDSDSDVSMSSSADYSVDPAKGVTFSGEPRELDAVLLHVRIKRALDSDVDSNESVRCAYLVSTFRGKAMDWFTRTLSKNPMLLVDYATLEALLIEVYGETDEVKKARSRARIMQLRQTATVQEFTAELEALADELEWPVSAREAFFYQGLHQGIKDALVLRDVGDYSSLKQEAKRYEALLAVSHSGRTQTAKKKKKKQGKCAKCGRTNHKTEDCFAKATVAMIRATVGDAPPEWQYQEISIGGRPHRALVDTGAQVNCMRANLLGREGTRPTNVTLYGPTGKPLVVNARALTAKVDDTVQTFYLVPELEEAVILGRPYFSRTSDTNVMSLNTTGVAEDGGRLRPLSDKEQIALDEYLKEQRELGVVRPSQASVAANILFVPKKNGTLRLCVDYRNLNKVTLKDRYPIPLIDDLLNKARGAKRYSVIDIKAAFNHVRIRPGDEHLTAFKTNRGLFEYTAMPFGLTNAPAVWQRHMDHVMEKFRDHAVWYLDDILVFTDEETHMSKLEEILMHLVHEGITVQKDKLVINQLRVAYLGRIITEDRVEADVDARTILEWPEPHSLQELQSFLGVCNWFRPFIPGFAAVAAPLYDKIKNYSWTLADSSHMSRLKNAVTNTIATHQFIRNQPLEIFTDASQFGVGAVLRQRNRTIGIISRGLTPAERNYTTTERELLAIVYAAKKWRHYFESTSHPIAIHTDHKSLTQALNAGGNNRRINRWVEILMPYHFSLAYVKGEENPADLPSRRPDYKAKFGAEGEPGLYSEDEDVEILWNGSPLMDGPPVHKDVCDCDSNWCTVCARSRKTVAQYYAEGGLTPTAAYSPLEDNQGYTFRLLKGERRRIDHVKWPLSTGSCETNGRPSLWDAYAAPNVPPPGGGGGIIPLLGT